MHTHVVLENILLTMIYNFDSSQYVCFSKKLAYLGKNSAFTQGNTMRAVLENLLVLFSVFFFFFSDKKLKNYGPYIRVSDCSLLAINGKSNNDVVIC